MNARENKPCGAWSSPALMLAALTVSLVFLSLPLAAEVKDNSLPLGWLQTSVGAHAPAAPASYKNKVFRIQGSGRDIWEEADEFTFVYREKKILGDGEAIARIDGYENGNHWTKAGFMMRQSLGADSPCVFSFLTPKSNEAVALLYRKSQGERSDWDESYPGEQTPYWVKLKREKTHFTGSMSKDGVHWVETGEEDIPNLTGPLFIGLAVSEYPLKDSRGKPFVNISHVKITE
ncbi:MAG: hypothetical protein L3J02_00690 [Henriciella sp.]|nr:hypothetical protein [Henriciella sp.]